MSFENIILVSCKNYSIVHKLFSEEDIITLQRCTVKNPDKQD